MSDDGDSDDFVPADTGEIVVSIQPEGVLVEGGQADVDQYVTRLRELVGHEVDAKAVNKALLGNAVGAAAGGASVMSQSAKFVQLSGESVKALRVGKKIPGDPGFYRMMTRGGDGRFLQQLQWKPTSVNPQRLMSAQMIAVQVALSSAIAQVDDSIKRVESKVDAVRQLVEASRAGDVIGHEETVARMARYLEKNGSLPDALWESVSSLSPTLEASVERLRSHATRVLHTLDPSQGSVADRARSLRSAVKDSKFAETLDLLIVAEDSLYKWQSLLVARVRATQPDHLEQVIEDSRELLARHLELDGQLYRQAKSVIDAIARRDDRDGFRFRAVQKLTHDRDTLSKALDDFARARRHQAETWAPLDNPGVLKATSATVDKAIESAGHAITGAGERLVKVGDFLAERERRRRTEGEDRHDRSAEND